MRAKDGGYIKIKAREGREMHSVKRGDVERKREDGDVKRINKSVSKRWIGV